MHVLRSPARTFFNDLVTTVVPADCRACGGPLLSAGHVPVCDACLRALAPQTKSLCRRCGEAVAISLNLEDIRFAGMLPDGLLCTPCRMVPPGFTRAVAFGEYRDELRTLIHLLKYERMRGVAERVAPQMAEAIRQLRNEAANELLVIAVPLFAAKQRQRGYNQSVLLADAAVKHLRKTDPGWSLTAAHSLIARVRPTEDQYRLAPGARRKNLRGAFEIADKSAIAGREVLVVDDILTTGATARECARVLNRAGAARVWVATLARAQAAGLDTHTDEFAADTAVWGADPTHRPTSFLSQSTTAVTEPLQFRRM